MDSTTKGRAEVLRLFLRHQIPLSSYLYTLAEDWEVVEEALQETAVFILGRWEDFTPGTSFLAWARTVARLRFLEIRNRQRRHAGPPLESVEDVIAPEEWDRQADFPPARKEALSRCLQALSADQKRLAELHYVERRPCEDIAGRLRKSVEAVYMALSRMRKRLKACVEERLAGEAP